MLLVIFDTAQFLPTNGFGDFSCTGKTDKGEGYCILEHFNIEDDLIDDYVKNGRPGEV